MQITPVALDAIFINFNTLYQQAYERAAPWWSKVAMEVPSTSRENRYGWMKIIPRMREWVGERKINNLAGRSYTIENKDWELSVGVERNAIQDDQLGLFGPAIAMMGDQAARHPDDLLTTLIQSGVTALAFDGLPFFSASHPVDSDNTALGTYSNNFTTTPLNSANFQSVRAAMKAFKGEDNKPLRVDPRLLIVPPQLEATALQILNAEFTAPAAAFGQNAAGGYQTNVLKGSADLLVIPELANEPTTWYLADMSKPVKPFVYQSRKAPVFVSLTAPTDENLFYRKEFIYGIDSRDNVGYSLPFLCSRAIA